MIRAKIFLLSIDHLEHAYHHLQSIKEIEIISVKNQLHIDPQNVLINVIFKNGIIGEIEFVYREKDPQFYANKFLQQLEKCG